MKISFTIGCLIISVLTFAQQDTIVTTDYTKIMIATDSDGEVYPITSLDDEQQAGFFMNEKPEGTVRVCHPEKLFMWVDGRLFDTFNGCRFYHPDALFQGKNADTIYVSFSTRNSLNKLECQLVIFEELHIVREEVALPRAVRDKFNEFVIISLLLILGFLGVIISNHPGRLSYLIEKTFTFKSSAYEFINTAFFSSPSMYLLIFFSLSLAFTSLYLDVLLSNHMFGIPETTGGFLWLWIQLAGGVFMLFIFKWLVISVVAQLFKFRSLKNFQLFDFLNFNTFLLVPVLLFLVVDFIINHSIDSWIGPGILAFFPVFIVLFVIWFTFKFVSNSPRRKLMIISYLCATEIIPVILLMGWFYK
ncbi:DUF4271 domain-containing protein [Ekhidna sp.]|uniref:DUF4271 domain-containing protein n=1 Tax=Ekhidna sp. TaxID=2608089 RepID=UPI003C7B4178